MIAAASPGAPAARPAPAKSMAEPDIEAATARPTSGLATVGDIRKGLTQPATG